MIVVDRLSWAYSNWKPFLHCLCFQSRKCLCRCFFCLLVCPWQKFHHMEYGGSFIVHPPFSILYTPSSILHCPSFTLTSIFHPPYSILHPPFSILPTKPPPTCSPSTCRPPVIAGKAQPKADFWKPAPVQFFRLSQNPSQSNIHG